MAQDDERYNDRDIENKEGEIRDPFRFSMDAMGGRADDFHDAENDRGGASIEQEDDQVGDKANRLRIRDVFDQEGSEESR